MIFVRITSLTTGILMILQWGFFLAAGSVPELKTEPFSIGFHLFAEFLTAFSLIMTFPLLKAPSPPRRILSGFAQGMLGYSVINSAGYFAQSGQLPFLVLFAVLLLVSAWNLIFLTRKPENFHT